MIRVTFIGLKTPPIDPRKIDQLSWLFASDRRLEELFDWVVQVYPHTAASAKLAQIHADTLRGK